MISIRYIKINSAFAERIQTFCFLVFIGFYFLISLNITSQTIDSTSYLKYKFIETKINIIENDSISLKLFYEKLYKLNAKEINRVNIVHIGDSHIQADNLSGTIRQKLQLKFGNAGRGLLFPYRVAKSNEPSSYKTSSNAKWESKRNVFYEKPLPIGVSGFTIETQDSLANINLNVKDQPGLGYSFTKFSLFHDKNVANFDIVVCDEYNCEKGIFRSSDSSTNQFVSELKLSKQISQLTLTNKCTDTAIQRSSRIYGMLLENDSSGIVYNMIGVNGAEYRHYNLSKYFLNQLPYLNPDLIIVSLGTNEAFNRGFDRFLFYNQIDTMITLLKKKLPNTGILITTPSDSFVRRKKTKVKIRMCN